MLLTVKRDKLVNKRKASNLSQHRLSVLAGLGGNAVFRMETQDYKVHPLRAKAVADALNCNVTDIFDTPTKAN